MKKEIKRAAKKTKKMIENAVESDTGQEVIRREKDVAADMMAKKAKEMKEESKKKR